jgi:hypothetical protein
MVHLLLVLGLKVWEMETTTEPEKPKTWLELTDESHQMQMSDSTKRVKKQTRARETSPTTLSTLTKPTPNAPPPSPKASNISQENRPRGKSLGEVLKVQSYDSGDVSFMSAGGGAVSSQARQQLQSFLPRDLELGDVTALNTDQNLFFTFYRRMAEKVIWPWAQNVSASFEKMRRMGQLDGTGKAWVTVVEVILDKNGTVVSTQPMQLSGLFDIDSAPSKAFNQAKNFPNPPSDMVEEDGYIHIRYKFVVFYNPKSAF